MQTHLLEFILEETIDETVSRDGGLADEFWRSEDNCEVYSFQNDMRLVHLRFAGQGDVLTSLAVASALCSHGRVMCMLGRAEGEAVSQYLQNYSPLPSLLTHSES